MWCRKGELGANAELIAVIQRYGLAVVPIIGSEPQMTFTIGLKHSYGHPELIIFGLAPRVAHLILNRCGAVIKENGPLEAGRTYDDFANLPTIFRHANPAKIQPHVFRCAEFYGGEQPPFLQVVWPDPASRFPWDKGFNKAYDRHQPKLWLGSPIAVIKG